MQDEFEHRELTAVMSIGGTLVGATLRLFFLSPFMRSGSGCAQI